MKTLLFAAALLTATSAFAQQPTTPPTQPPTSTEDQSTQPQTDMPDADAPGQQTAPDPAAGSTQQMGTPDSTTTTNSWNSSGPARAPAPAQGVATWPTASNPQPATGDYPRCSRTVTDHCRQNR